MTVENVREMMKLSPAETRNVIRRKEWKGPVAGIIRGFAQANLVFP